MCQRKTYASLTSSRILRSGLSNYSPQTAGEGGGSAVATRGKKNNCHPKLPKCNLSITEQKMGKIHTVQHVTAVDEQIEHSFMKTPYCHDIVDFPSNLSNGA